MLHKETVTAELFDVLEQLMELPVLSPFRLVGGTSLSLAIGHRMSEDIDLFTHETYGSVDFEEIEKQIRARFSFVSNSMDVFPEIRRMPNHTGVSLQVGQDEPRSVKVDIMNWSEPFFEQPETIEGIRSATIKDIALMKMETISKEGRKKDFWDMSAILEKHSLSSLLDLYAKHKPYYSVQEVKDGFVNFTKAEQMPDPICLNKKTWEDIKSDLKKKVQQLTLTPKKSRGLWP